MHIILFANIKKRKKEIKSSCIQNEVVWQQFTGYLVAFVCACVCVWSLYFLYHFLYLHSSSLSFLIGKCYYYYLTVERIWSIQKINFFSALDTNWCCRLVKFKFKFDWHWSNRLAIRWDLLGSRNQALFECKSTSTIRYDVFVLNFQF